MSSQQILSARPGAFQLDNDTAYQAWRSAKLACYPATLADLVVELADPRQPSAVERAALGERLACYNMALYTSGVGPDPDKAIPRGIGELFGLTRLDCNYLSDDDGITSLTVNPEGEHPRYIPYTNRPIKWHTDGYYNTPEKQIHGLILHCVQPAASGGENQLLDQEILYILLRDEDPDYIRALMDPEAMAIPPGKDSEGGERAVAVGPVYQVQADNGALHMRYTARKRNIQWNEDPAVQRAKERLEALLESDLPYVFAGRLEPGMGLICNNVLHDRAGFTDDPGAPKRLLYRARYFDRVIAS